MMLTRQDIVDATARNSAFPELVITDFYRRAGISGTVVDGGAHLGYHTQHLAALPDVTRVVAVEPCDDTRAHLLDRMTHWPGREKVQVVGAALQDDPLVATVQFFAAPDQPGRNGINPIMRAHGQEYDPPVTVPATTIDMLVAGDQVEFIKLDLEGAEYAALRGARETLTRSRPAIAYECGVEGPEMNGYTVAEFLGFFDSLGYVPVTETGRIMDEQGFREYWNAWAFPKERLDAMRALVQDVVTSLIERAA